MNDYKELLGDIGDCLIAQPSEAVYKRVLREAADAIEQLIKERDAAIADLKEYASCDYCKHSNSECDEYWAIGEMGLSGLCNGEHFEWRGVQEAEHE